ncbi:hypothetical protein MSG28_012920 [Choristoneura fumiferana]|uniref:Uncharacterized protein n=1 Tax=Choristoneura fumiferana TaxID=7141 RepID=A0ACC0KRD5_CHOFU|nr:hypothetical protein MSG28_012920 [Choristoneura fumiferana]
MEEGFVEAYSYNLPKVSVDMVVRFFAASTEIKASKCSVGESFGDSAIKFVQIKRDAGLCTVKSRVTPEHAINLESYRATVVIDEDEDVVRSCQCDDCALCPDACRHAVAFLLWLHRRSEEPPTTSAICYWDSATLSNQDDTTSVMTVKEMLGIKEVKMKPDTRVLDEFIKVAKEKNIDCLLMRHIEGVKQKLSLHQLCVTVEGQLHCPQALLQALVAEMTSVTEADVTPWCEVWYGRIKDSMLHEAVHCPEKKDDLVERILGEESKYTHKEMAKRKRIKKAVLKEVSKKAKMEITEIGALLNPAYPVLGAAPDGVTNEHTIEIKLPSDDQTLLSYVKDNKLSMEIWSQVQAQMYFSKKTKALFCVALPNFATTKAVEIFPVPYDESIEIVLDRAQQFWIDAVFPVLMTIYNQ